MRRFLRPTVVLAGAVAVSLGASPLQAQKGAGTTGATLLQLTPGSRAGALSGAYTAASGDADVIFYNPAGIGTLRSGASLSYERFVEDVSLGSGAGVLHFGSLALGLGASYLDAGSISELVPDPNFGGERGEETGRTLSANESSIRLAAALPLGDRLRIGAGAGFVSSSVAEQTNGAPLFDLGAQMSVLPSLTLGASLRNLGGSLAEGDRLPSEARAGATFETATPAGLGLLVSADYVARLREGTSGLVAGVEAGLLPHGASRFGAVARVGYSADDAQSNLGAMELGGGLTLGHVALDYTYRNLDFFGAVHRFGVRIAR